MPARHGPRHSACNGIACSSHYHALILVVKRRGKVAARAIRSKGSGMRTSETEAVAQLAMLGAFAWAIDRASSGTPEQEGAVLDAVGALMDALAALDGR